MCYNHSILSKIYQTYILPIMEYASPAWAALPASDEHHLEALQRRAIRTILNLPHTFPLHPNHYSEVGITPLKTDETLPPSATDTNSLTDPSQPNSINIYQPK